MRVPAGMVKQAEIATSTDTVAKALAPDVVRIRFSVGEDWSGDPAIYFRILLSDAASRESRLKKVAPLVTSRLVDEVKPYDMGLNPYFSFRSQSEQKQLREKSWA